MKKGILLLGIIFLLIFVCSSKEQSPAEETTVTGVQFHKLTLAEAKELAIKQNKLIMVDFFSPT